MANHNHKLSFHMDHTPSSLRWDPPGSATPPPQKPGSVPFLWEEKPGMPKKNSSTTSNIFKPFSDVVTPAADSTGPLSVRSLELPPRLVAKMKAMQMQRHVDYDGPGLTSEPGSMRVHVTCHSFSYYREGKKKVKRQKDQAWFWPKRKKNQKSKKLGEELMMMPTPKLSRNRSLTSVLSDSHHTSHFWASIRENFKQVVSWRKQGKNDHC